MTEWKKITANSNLIQTETAKAVLIKLPKSELKFWHPAKLVRTSGKGGYRMTFSYTDEFVFKCFRTGNGRYNRSEHIEDVELSAAEMEARFGADGEE